MTEPELKKALVLDKVITVLDADLWEAREAFGPLFYNQLEMAHLILLNKIDLVNKDMIPQFLKEMHEIIPDCQIVPTIQCQIDPETLWSAADSDGLGLTPIDFYDSRPVKEDDSSTPGLSDKLPDPDHVHPEHESESATDYVTFSFQTSLMMHEACFKAFIEALPWEMFRIKGPVRFENRTVLLNFVGGKGDWSTWEGNPDTRLAFIGWGVDQEEILGKLRDCIVNS